MTAEEFAHRAGLTFAEPSLLLRALTHRSYLNEHCESLQDNERLEFLGDAVLDFLSGSWLYGSFPEMDEGQLTRLRSSLVRTESLASFALEMGLGEAIRLGRGEETSGGRERPALLCATFEALVGAMYLDTGLDVVARFMEPRWQSAIEVILRDETHFDPRSLLQMWAQAELGQTPKYQTIHSSGPDHARQFEVEVHLGNGVRGRGQGFSKQYAAQEAAADALSQVGRPARRAGRT